MPADLSRLAELAAERSSFRGALKAVTQALAGECRVQLGLGARKTEVARAARIPRATLDIWLRQRTEEK